MPLTRHAAPFLPNARASLAGVLALAAAGCGAAAPPLGGELPWPLAAAAALALAAALLQQPAPHDWSLRAAAWVAASVAAAGALAAIRHGLVAPAFLHQNGQGPLWADYARSCLSSPYGPGYAELFGIAASADDARPHAGVFVANAWLYATMPLAAWFVARAAGAGGALAVAIATLFALDPAAARIGASETYFAPLAALHLAAAALLARATAAAGDRLSRFWILAVVSAGLIAAQAARVHPVGWFACATLPLTVCGVPGPPARRVLQTALAAAIVGLVVVATSLGAMLDAMGAGTAPSSGDLLAWVTFDGAFWTSFACAAAVALALGVATRAWRAAALPAVAAAILAVVFHFASRIHPWTDVFEQAHARLYAGPAVAVAVSLAASVLPGPRGQRVLCAALIVAALPWFALRAPAWTARSVSHEEQRLADLWLQDLPAGSRVAFVTRAGELVYFMPRSRCSADATRLLPIVDDPDARIGADAGPTHYYRASMCALDGARGVCEAAERMLSPARLVQAWKLPVVEAVNEMPYVGPTVEVSLWQLAPPDPTRP